MVSIGIDLISYSMCVGSCVKGYYQDKRTCKGCYKLCKACIGGNINQCTSCINDFFLDHNGHCVEKCPDGYFAGMFLVGLYMYSTHRC